MATMIDWLDLGIEFLRRDDLAAAEGVFEALTKIAPDLAAGWYHLGRVLERQDRPFEARAAFDRAAALDAPQGQAG